jgi:hypothetical protein
VFGASKLESSPTQYVPDPTEVVKSTRAPLSEEDRLVFEAVIHRIRSFVKSHGSDVKSWFKDFDKNNTGIMM